jgi:Ca2+-binding RTX toxin-like protein
MAGIANSIISQKYAYNTFARLPGGSFSESEAHLWVALNSNSFVTSIMYHMGIDPAANMPTNLGVTPGDNTLLDIAGGHTLTVGSWFTDIFAGDGADTVTGNADQNYLFGGSGNDILNGGDGDDILSGGQNADILNGGAGDDILFGNNAGADTLRGGGGSDDMYGSAGVDTFDYNALAESAFDPGFFADEIFNYAAGSDRIDLRTIDANPDLAGNQAFAFVGGETFTAVGQIRFINTSIDTRVFINGVGPGGADMLIRIDGIHAITEVDFLL